ncbi:MAG: hypothetical protein Kow0020_10320 [Wenzhouxiangellaceae bacterium]
MSEVEIRSVLVPLHGVELLIPNAVIAEVIGYSDPDPIDDAPDWLLGGVLWRGWQVPVVAYAQLVGLSEREPTEGAKICVTKSLAGNQRMPYIGLLAQSYPRLVTVREDALTEVPEPAGHIAIAGRAILADRECVVPELDRFAQLVAHAAFGALPVGH